MSSKLWIREDEQTRIVHDTLMLGMTIRESAKHHGRSPATIHRIMSQAGYRSVKVTRWEKVER